MRGRTAVEWESELSRLAAVTVALELITTALVVSSSANGGGVSIAQEVGERLWGKTERGRWGGKLTRRGSDLPGSLALFGSSGGAVNDPDGYVFSGSHLALLLYL